MNDRLEELRGRLEAVEEELADLAMEALRRAADDGGDGVPDDDAGEPTGTGAKRWRGSRAQADAVAEERRLTKARRAVAKAIAVLDDRDDAD